MQYRASFVLQSTGQLLHGAIEFLGILALFARFGNVKGWSLPEVAFFYGTVNVAFALSDALGRGFDLFGRLVKSGDFDRLLLRPRTTILQILGFEFTLKRIGRFIQGAAVLIWSLFALGLHWSAAHIVLYLFTICGVVVLFLSLLIIQATISFWTVETLEIMNILTYGGVETAQFPLSLYHRFFRRFFTFVVPLACVSFYPISQILGRVSSALPLWFPWTAPLAGFFFFGLSLLFWRFGVRHYTSTGS